MTTTPTDAERLERRYPSRTSSTRIVVAAGLVATVLGLAWLAWTALFHANPTIVARVASFTVTDDGSVSAVVTVQRSSPEVSGTCTVIAQAVTFERVGEISIEVGAGGGVLTNHPVTLKTLKRATSASVEGCTAH